MKCKKQNRAQDGNCSHKGKSGPGGVALLFGGDFV